jgi:hypothetical protein
MTIKNKIIAGVVVFVLIVLGVHYASKQKAGEPSPSPEATTTTADASSTVSVKSVDSTPSAGASGGLKTITLLDRVWMTFEEYLSRAHAHDIEGVKALSYKQSATCAKKETEKQCFALMDGVYSFGKDFQKTDYKNISSDDKQVILFTNPHYDDGEKQYGLIKGYLYFTREKDGSVKLLAMDPARGWYVDKASSTKADWVQKLDALSADSDSDGISDNEENCLDAKGVAIMQCVKSDPKKRDSKGDGWWDSVRVYINRM